MLYLFFVLNDMHKIKNWNKTIERRAYFNWRAARLFRILTFNWFISFCKIERFINSQLCIIHCIWLLLFRSTAFHYFGFYLGIQVFVFIDTPIENNMAEKLTIRQLLLRKVVYKFFKHSIPNYGNISNKTSVFSINMIFQQNIVGS